MATTKVDNILNLYKQLSQNPTLTSAKIICSAKNGIAIQSTWSQRNLERRKKQKFNKDFICDGSLNVLFESSPIDVTNEILKTSTADEEYEAILRDVVIDGKSKQFIEIWDKQHLIKSYDLSAYDVHGDVYLDATFSSFHWSPDKTSLLYIAEKKLQKSEPFYTNKPKSKSKKLDDQEEVSRGTEYVFKPDWGEQLVGKHQSVIVILNIQDDTINPITSIPENFFPAQATWVPDSDEIVGVVYTLHPRYLGQVFCTNRESYIFHLKGSEFRKLSKDGVSCRSPRFSPDGSYLIWIERNISPAHHHVQRFMNIEWKVAKDPSILIDVVNKEIIIAKNKKFYGIYNQGLPKRCWSDDSKYFFFSTAQRSSVKSYVIRIETREIFEIENNQANNMYVLDAKKNFILFMRTSLIQPSQLLIGKFDSTTSDMGSFKLVECTKSLPIPNGDSLMYETTEYVYNNNESCRDFNFIYLGRKGAPEKSMPIIVVPHGGPHSTFSDDFTMSHIVLALLGFGVIRINYRGSTGLGGDNIEYILGKVGDSDVLDCITSVNEALKKYPWLNPGKVTAFGGSHGGFLSAHLSAQYPDMFKAVVMRNPVIDVAAMFSISDIPDCRRSALTVEERIKFHRWFRCPGETGCTALGRLPETTPPADYPELIQIMLKHSPILLADKVKAPTLIALGLKDLRVPSSQGKLWYYRLRENNVISKLYIYDDNHSLSKDEVDIDFLINAALWLMEYTSDKKSDSSSK